MHNYSLSRYPQRRKKRETDRESQSLEDNKQGKPDQKGRRVSLSEG